MDSVLLPIGSFILNFLIICILGGAIGLSVGRGVRPMRNLLAGMTVTIGVYALYMAIVGFMGGLKYSVVWSFVFSVLLIVIWFFHSRRRAKSEQTPTGLSEWKPPDAQSKVLMWVLIIFQVVLFFNAIVPFINQDAEVSHYLFIKRYIDSGQVTVFPENGFSYYPQAMEMVVTAAFQEAGEYGPDAANICFWFIQLILIGWLIDFCAGRGKVRSGYMLAIATCGLFYWPVIAFSGYVDGAVALFSLSGMFAYFDWLENRSRSDSGSKGFTSLMLAGFLLGTACASKYSALPIVFLVFVHFLWILITDKVHRTRNWRILAGAAIMFLIPVIPWYLRNIIVTGNPVFPFMRGIFGGPELTLADDVNTWATWGMPITFVNYIFYPLKLAWHFNMGDSWIRVPYIYISWLFVLTPLAGILLFHRRLHRLIAIWCFIFFTFAFFVMNLQTRYFIPFTILGLWLVIEWLDSFVTPPSPADRSTSAAVRSKHGPGWAKWLVFIIVFFPFLFSLFANVISNGYERTSNRFNLKIAYITGQITRDEYIRDINVWPSLAVFEKANEVATEDSRVLIFSLRTYHLTCPYVLPDSEIFDPEFSPTQILNRIPHVLGIKYLLVEWRVRTAAKVLQWVLDVSDPSQRFSIFHEGMLMDAMGEKGVSRDFAREILRHRGGTRYEDDGGAIMWCIDLSEFRDPKIAGILKLLSQMDHFVETERIAPIEVTGEWELYVINY